MPETLAMATDFYVLPAYLTWKEAKRDFEFLTGLSLGDPPPVQTCEVRDCKEVRGYGCLLRGERRLSLLCNIEVRQCKERDPNWQPPPPWTWHPPPWPGCDPALAAVFVSREFQETLRLARLGPRGFGISQHYRRKARRWQRRLVAVLRDLQKVFAEGRREVDGLPLDAGIFHPPLYGLWTEVQTLDPNEILKWRPWLRDPNPRGRKQSLYRQSLRTLIDLLGHVKTETNPPRYLSNVELALLFAVLGIPYPRQNLRAFRDLIARLGS